MHGQRVISGSVDGEWNADPTQLFAECKDDSSSSLCVQHPREIASVMFTVGSALVIKGALTIITFGIKLPGES